MKPSQLVLFTDFGWQDPYVGQLKTILHGLAPGVPVIDLMHSVPDFNAHAGAHLLSALSTPFPIGSVFLCVVDPGVGGTREAVVVEADGRWYVGPDNGLLSIVAHRAREIRCWRIVWKPTGLSDSFHGRDLFAPVAGRIAAGQFPETWVAPMSALNVQFDGADLSRVIYVDHYGNAWTGIRGGLADPRDTTLIAHGHALAWRRVFSEAPKGQAFWYVNSAGLIEIAVNRGHGAHQLGLTVGDVVKLSAAPESHLH